MLSLKSSPCAFFMGLSFLYVARLCFLLGATQGEHESEHGNPGITRSGFIAFSAVSGYTMLPERLLCRVQYPSCSSSHSKSCLEASVLGPTFGEISLREETSSGPPKLTVERNHFVGNAGGCGWGFQTRVTLINTSFVCGIICLNK